MSFKVKSRDHLVLTVADMQRTLEFGSQKINLHEADATFTPKPLTPTAGSADLCFLIDGTGRDAAVHLQWLGVAIEQGPIERAGAGGKSLRSVYFRDPDGNLVELAELLPETSSSISSP